MRFKTTRQQTRFWKERKIDWAEHYLATWDHPHRQLIAWLLETIPWMSLWEVGCGPGANLVKIFKSFPGKQMTLGGSDVSEDAIALAKATFIQESTDVHGVKVQKSAGKFHCESADNIFLSDDAVDVTLADATLIYVGPRKIHKTLAEMVRVTRNHIILCEFHGTSWWRRWWLRLTTGYNAYNYQELLERHGCYNIKLYKIPPECWAGFPWQPWGYLIIANVTKL